MQTNKTKQNQLSLFRSNLPSKAYCCDGDFSKLRVRQVATARHMRYIQPNHFNSKLWLVFDIDRPTCVDEITDDLGLLPPHLFVQNPANNHAHVLYGLETSVHLNENSSLKAIRFAGAVDVEMTTTLKADAGYGKLVSKNPLHKHWRTYQINCEQYSLSDLAESLDLSGFNDNRTHLPAIGLGRNSLIFDQTRKWSYKAIRQGWPDFQQWHRAVLDRTTANNLQLSKPLPHEEIRHIAKSIAAWTHRNFNASAFSALQSHRGRKGGKVSKRLSVETSEQSLKPWLKMGISRATYYRKKNETG